MKYQFTLLFTVLFSCMIMAQDNLCESSYMPFQKGVQLEYTTFNHKGKETGQQVQSVREITEVDGGFRATIDFKVMDKKGKDVTDSSFDMECQNGTVRMDMSSMIDPAMMESMGGLEAEVTGEDIQFPNNPKTGQELPDGTMTIKASVGGLGGMNTTVKMVDRKVEGFEEVNTPAGTFECVKISQVTETQMMGFNRSSKSISWMAKGIGTIKTENYNPNGKLESTMLLTGLKR